MVTIAFEIIIRYNIGYNKVFTYQGRGTTTVMRSQRAIPKRTIFVGLDMCFLQIS